MAGNRKWIYACGAGGMLLAAACQAEPSQVPAERPMSYRDAGVVLGPPFQGGKPAAEAERLSRLRALVHQASIHCSDPHCPICNPQNPGPGPL